MSDLMDDTGPGAGINIEMIIVGVAKDKERAHIIVRDFREKVEKFLSDEFHGLLESDLVRIAVGNPVHTEED